MALVTFTEEFLKGKLHFLCKVRLQGKKLNAFYSYSHQTCSMRKGVLRNFTKFTGKHLRQSLFFNKTTGVRSATLLKKRLWHRCFLVNLTKFFRTSFLQNTFGRLLLHFFKGINLHRIFRKTSISYPLICTITYVGCTPMCVLNG